ncbi:delta-sarcoglycan isoform X2 [Carassius auratus]|uniref:Delta-sarcoglycan isoform X2 n=1 Tax=Carassius auratus TaxID=7957 RepID=A0A6P6IUQ3_CARAU|nr:delta-sarcoglycan isoform X2 [Carassius auratus]XP_052444148.1 delta-sarcoglycan isoform X2 [Carassius gibelio]
MVRMMTQEQCPHRNNVQSTEKPQVYKVGIYGWRKRCLYFFVLLLMILIVVNLALTIWILKVMNFTIDGMGHLRITERGLKLEGDSEFLQPLYAKEIQSRPGSPLFLQSSKNVSVNILNEKKQVVSQLTAGSHGVHARGKMLEVKSSAGKLLFSADDHEVVVGAERLRVMGAEGAVFSNSVETPHVRAEPFKELRLESPTRSLYMEAPKGVKIEAEAGDFQATCRSDLRLESKDGEISLDARKIKLLRLPEGKASPSGTRQTVFEGQSSEAQANSSSSEAEPGPSETSPPQSNSAMAMVFADIFKTEKRRTKPLSDIIHEEVTSYKATGCISVDEDPLAWWKNNEHKYPHIAKLAQCNLAVQCTSVPSEHVFSKMFFIQHFDSQHFCF